MSDSLEVLSASGQDRKRWLDVLSEVSPLETYAHPGWLHLHCGEGEAPFLLVAQRSEGPLIFPLIIRNLGGLPWVPRDLRDRVDVTGPPFGWTGPFGPSLDEEAARAFWEAYAAWGKARGVVTDYRLFCPATPPIAAYPGERIVKMPVVVQDFPVSEEALWRGYDHKVRKNVNRARSLGLTVEVEETGERLEAFLDVFWTTLDRRAAHGSYYFERPFFEALSRHCPGGFTYFHVIEEGRTISTELVIRAGKYLYSFLGGTRADRFEARPNDLLKHEVSLWGMRHGYRGYVLGGGTTGEDGIFRYKLSFAPEGRKQLEYGRWVLDTQAFEALTKARLAHERATAPGALLREGFFPAYRAPLEIQAGNRDAPPK